MNPDSSDLYSFSSKITDAVYPRCPGSIVTDKPQLLNEEDMLKICYRKYQRKGPGANGVKVNLVFNHGTGMNKGLWHYHIDELYRLLNSEGDEEALYLNTVIAIDVVNHCDSGFLNKKKLGPVLDWRDCARDVIKILTLDEADEYVHLDRTINILVGHSMGGVIGIHCGILCPSLFSSLVIINPVSYMGPYMADPSLRVFEDWYEKGFLENQFKFKHPDNWRSELNDHFKKWSFFRKFHPQVLENFLHDEIQRDDSSKKSLSEISLKTEAKNVLQTYKGFVLTIVNVMPLYKYMRVPLYYVYSENDSLPKDSVDIVRSLIPLVHHIDVPKTKHLFNAENPDHCTHLILSVITETFSKQQAAPLLSLNKHTFSTQGSSLLQPKHALSLYEKEGLFPPKL